jgi:large subunit ribosomal protein L15
MVACLCLSLVPDQTLKDAGAIGKAMRDGVKLLGRGSDDFKYPIKIEVSFPPG